MVRDKSRGTTHLQLMCEPVRIEYDFTRRRGLLVMAEGDCCDMNGCIKLFQAMDQDVTLIDTYSGHVRDTSYVLVANGMWQSLSG